MIAKLVQVAPIVMVNLWYLQQASIHGFIKETASYGGHKHNKHMSVYIYIYMYIYINVYVHICICVSL